MVTMCRTSPLPSSAMRHSCGLVQLCRCLLKLLLLREGEEGLLPRDVGVERVLP